MASSKASLAIPTPLSVTGNQWVQALLKMPVDMVTGDVTSTSALANGSFSDEVSQYIVMKVCVCVLF